MIWLYRLLFIPVALVLSPYYARRMLKRGGYGRNFGQRFGVVPPLPDRLPGVKRIWIQAVSVGEIMAIGPLLERLRGLPGCEIYLTTTTSTGYKIALDRYIKHTIAIGYFPIDCWFFSARAWREIQPDMAILTEGERWPEHVHQAKSRGVPVLAINARMSDRGFRRMKAAPWLMRSLFAGITRFMPCSIQDEERLLALGFPRERIVLTGNIKLDVTIPLMEDGARAQLRQELGFGEGLVLLGSSTWPGEEKILLATLRAARKAGLAVFLLLVPRHAERREEIREELQRSGYAFHFRSKGVAPAPVDVAVGDTTGELRKLTQLADLVFVGKSLHPHHEGQTPVEAAVLEKPILFGPEMSNFRQIAKDLVAIGAAKTVSGGEELSVRSIELLKSAELRQRMSAAGRLWHVQNQGSLGRTLDVIRSQLGA